MEGGPRSSSSDNHHHPEYWSAESHYRFEERLTREVEKLEEAVNALTIRITLMLGGLTLIAFLLPILAPFMRALLNLDTPAGQ